MFLNGFQIAAQAEVSTSKTSNSLFLQTLNPMTGHKEWKVVPNDYDYQQELARAAFADMLHDNERVKLTPKISLTLSAIAQDVYT
jgi:hypothetical protein